MGYRLRGSGFQSIAKPVEILLSGLTVVWGESNIGKSALIRLIQAAFSNRLGTEFISVGQDSARLEWSEEGRDFLAWEKKGSATTYQVGAKTISRPGRGIPPEILPYGIQEVATTDRKRFWPQIQAQGEPPFILAERSGTTAAELLGSNPQILQVNGALRLSGVDLKQQLTLVSVLEGQLDEVRRRRSLMEGREVDLDRAWAAVIGARDVLESTRARRDVLASMGGRWDRLESARGQLDRARAVALPPRIDFEGYRRLQEIERRYRGIEALLARPPVVPPDRAAVLGMRDRLIGLIWVWGRVLDIHRRMTILDRSRRLVIPPRVDGRAPLQAIESLATLEDRFRRNRQKHEALERRRDEVRGRLRDLDREHEALRREVGDLEECPFCRSPIRDGKFSRA